MIYIKYITLAGYLLVFPASLTAQRLTLLSAAGNQTEARNVSPDGFEVIHTLQEVSPLTVNTPLGEFTSLVIPGYAEGGPAGHPGVPSSHHLLEIPAGAEVKVTVLSSHYTEYSLSSLGWRMLMPTQPPQPKSGGRDPAFHYDSVAYGSNRFFPSQLAGAEVLGMMRGYRIGRLTVSPVRYNPVTGMLRIYDEIRLKVSFDRGDALQTRLNRQKNNNLYFSRVASLFLNSLPQSVPADDLTQAPVKYVIVSPPAFQSALQDFIQWKRKKGFTVIEAYTSDPAVGTTTASIKAYLQGLYEAGTNENPPPSFVLFVGDVAQVPAWTGNQGSHPTDLYYCEYTGDIFPEVYYGRFSAATLAQLQPQLDKTLQYEQYTMPDPTFLDHCVMIAGVDGTFGPTHANGQINYGTATYFNAAHGLTSHTYLYPASGSQDAQIRQDVSDGCCFANYTAHGSSSGWADPSFTTAHVPAMTNTGKYPLMVGNACLTNKFNDSECFGEALLRASGKGAVGYIGASNNTYWNEDFYWACGAKPVTVNPVFNAGQLGAYDRTFHDHGEAYGEWFMTQGQMVHAGNLAVTQGNPGFDDYYWEVYHLMGDPSLMIYYSQPQALAAAYASPLPLAASTFTVTTEPYAYAALSMGGVLYGAALADASGVAEIPVQPFMFPGTADVVVTKQFFQPFIGTVQVANPNAPHCVYQQHLVSDPAGNNNGQADFGETILLGITLQNIGLQPASGVSATLATADTLVTITDNSETYGTIAAGASVTVAGGFGLTLSQAVPDGHVVSFLLTITDGTLAWSSTFTLTVHAPVLTYYTHSVADPAGNQNGRLDPAETATLQVTLQNSGSLAAFSLTGTLSTASGLVTVNTPVQNIPVINPASGGQFSFSVTALSSTPPGTQVTFDLAVTAAGGISLATSFSLVVGQIPVLVVDLDGNGNAASAIQQAVTANNLGCELSTAIPPNPGLYSCLFVCLGIYPSNHVLTVSEGQALASYLDDGGMVYLEGGDTWYYDTPTGVHPYFGITGQNDGSGDLNTLNGQAGTFTEGLSFSYAGENSWIDRITAVTGSGAFVIFQNDSPLYGTAVAIDGGTFRTIGASHEFAGLSDASFPSTKNELMRLYLGFFGLLSSPVTAGFVASPTTLNQGGTAAFTDLSAGDPVSWNWSFPGGIPSTSVLQHPVITYPSPGAYPVTLAVSNGTSTDTLTLADYITVNQVAAASFSLGSYSGCTDTFAIPVSVTGLAGVSSISLEVNFPMPGLQFCGYGNVHPALDGNVLLVNASGSTVFVSWVSLTPLSLASGELLSLSFLPSDTGTFPLEWNTGIPGFCQITDLAGNDLPAVYSGGSSQITGTSVPVAVSISASPSAAICEGEAVTFTASGVNAGNTPSYAWTVNGIAAGSGETCTSAALAQGDVVQCVLTSGADCATGNPAVSNPLVMTVYPMPVADLGNDTTLVGGNPFTLDAGPGFTSYLWSTGGTSQTIGVTETGEYSVTVTNDQSCSDSDTVYVSVLLFNGFSGQISYANPAQTPLSNMAVNLKSGNTNIMQTTTLASGWYGFSPVSPGTYQVVPACAKPWGGVNATDALLIMKHFVGLQSLSGISLKAADVDGSGVANAVDALAVQRRSVGMINSFPMGDWAFLFPTVLFTGLEEVVADFPGLCYGDVNGSYLPPALAVETVSLAGEGTLLPSEGSLTEIPVTTASGIGPGAITLYLGYDPGRLDILDVEGPCRDGSLAWHARNGTLGISWYSLEGSCIPAGGPVFYVRAMLKTGAESYLPFDLLPGGEFADREAGLITGVNLRVPMICFDGHLQLTVGPIPFSESLAVSFATPDPGPVEVNILSPEGQLVRRLLNEVLPAGNWQIGWNPGSEQNLLPNGLLILQLRTANHTLYRKIVRSR